MNVLAESFKNTLPLQTYTINGSNYQLEVAQTRQQLQLGLMGRTSLPKNNGMLFVFPKFTQHGFWMKNMSIPLSVAWLDKQMRVISVHKLYPCHQYNCPITSPLEKSAYVIELSIDNTIKVGDQLMKLKN